MRSNQEPKSLLDAEKKKEVIKSVLKEFEGSHLSMSTIVSFELLEPEIGMFEFLFKPPENDPKELKQWHLQQDQYWKAIANEIKCPLPNPLPKFKLSNGILKPNSITTYVKNFLKQFKESILKLPDAEIPDEIRTVLSQSVTIESFKKVAAWKAARDSLKSLVALLNFQRIPHKVDASVYKDYPQILQMVGLLSSVVEERLSNTSINKLNLQDCNLNFIPDVFCKLKIKHLDLSFNRLIVLPELFGQLDSLESLNLFGNLLTVLPSFKEMKWLQKINLGDNLITSVPDFNTDKLNEINLSGNNIEKLPKSIGPLQVKDNAFLIIFRR